MAIGPVAGKHLVLVQKALENYYQVEVTILDRVIPLQPLYQQKDTARIRVFEAWKYLPFYKKGSINKVIALTEKDISWDYQIRGVAFVKRGVAIISTGTIREEARSNAQFKRRLAKVALHEAGHLYALPHCETSTRCFMVTSIIKNSQPIQTDPTTFYHSRQKLCSPCQSRIDSVRKHTLTPY